MRPLPRPFLKWAGGKSRLLPALVRRLPDTFGTYHEPFLGGGALFFHMASQGRITRAFLSDINSALIDAYVGVRDHIHDLIARLSEHARRHDHDYYYQIRDQAPADADIVERAARMIYLNRTCYNGLYRESRSGRFNVPIGRYRHPRICDEPLLRAASEALSPAEIHCAPFHQVVERAAPGDFVYLDPPYHPVSGAASFTSYHRSGFSEDQQRRLGLIFRRLADGGVDVLLSNSDTGLIQEIYGGLRRDQVQVPRSINSRGSGRGAVNELIIRAGPAVA